LFVLAVEYNCIEIGIGTWIWADAPAGYNVCWGECGLFDLSKEIDWVLVERDLAERDKWEIYFRDCLRSVKNVRSVVLGCLRVDDLGVYAPRWEGAVRNGVEEISGGTVWVFSAELYRLGQGKICDTLVSL
jgi:hypothetical protein